MLRRPLCLFLLGVLNISTHAGAEQEEAFLKRNAEKLFENLKSRPERRSVPVCSMIQFSSHHR